MRLARRLFTDLRLEGAGRAREAVAMGLGAFIGCLPFYGFHLLMVIVIGWLFRLNRPGLQFARAHAYIGNMDDLTYWTKKLRQAKQELDAARTRTDVDEAAARYQRAKAELKRLEADQPASKRRTSRGSRL